MWLVEVDRARSATRAIRNEGLEERLRLADEADDRAIVVGVRLHVEDRDAVDGAAGVRRSVRPSPRRVPRRSSVPTRRASWHRVRSVDKCLVPPIGPGRRRCGTLADAPAIAERTRSSVNPWPSTRIRSRTRSSSTGRKTGSGDLHHLGERNSLGGRERPRPHRGPRLEGSPTTRGAGGRA